MYKSFRDDIDYASIDEYRWQPFKKFDDSKIRKANRNSLPELNQATTPHMGIPAYFIVCPQI